MLVPVSFCIWSMIKFRCHRIKLVVIAYAFLCEPKWTRCPRYLRHGQIDTEICFKTVPCCQISPFLSSDLKFLKQQNNEKIVGTLSSASLLRVRKSTTFETLQLFADYNLTWIAIESARKLP